MANKKLDKDTERVMAQTKVSHDWVNSDGYRRFKKLAMEKIVQNTSLLRLQTIPGFSTEQILSDYGARKMLGSLLIQTLQEIEGEADSYESNWALLNKVEEDQLHLYLPENEDRK